MNDIQNQGDMADLLDADLDDLKDLPEFGVIPVGTYDLEIKWEAKKINDSPAQELKLKVVEVVELSDPTETPPAVGSESSILFFMDSEFGQGAFKKVVAAFSPVYGSTHIRTLVDSMQGSVVRMVIGQTTSKNNGKVYNSVKKVLV